EPLLREQGSGRHEAPEQQPHDDHDDARQLIELALVAGEDLADGAGPRAQGGEDDGETGNEEQRRAQDPCRVRRARLLELGDTVAGASAHASASSSAPRRWAIPRRSASVPSNVSAASSIARAGPWPARRATRCTVQWSTTSPSLAAGMPKRASGVATRRSHAA